MKRNAAPEPDIYPIHDKAPSYSGLAWQAAEDRTSGELVLNLEYCGRDPAAIGAAIRLLQRLSTRVEMGLTKR